MVLKKFASTSKKGSMFLVFVSGMDPGRLFWSVNRQSYDGIPSCLVGVPSTLVDAISIGSLAVCLMRLDGVPLSRIINELQAISVFRFHVVC